MVLKQLAAVVRKDRAETAMAEAMRKALQARFNREWRKVADETIARLQNPAE